MKFLQFFLLPAMILPALPQRLSAHVWDELAILARNQGDGTFSLDRYAYLQPSIYTAATFFDYDNDGNLDLLLMGQGGDWNISGEVKMVLLYHNLGAAEDFRFERVADAGFLQYRDEAYYNPISVGDINHDGYSDVALMSTRGGRSIDLYLNDAGTGRFIRQEQTFQAATNGSVMLADMDNDGWLDLEYSGYADDTPTALRLYRNNRDGSFSPIAAPSLSGAFQGQSVVADVDGDGVLDIVSTGNDASWACLASLYYGAIGETSSGTLSYRYVSESESGLLGVSRANVLVADLNADGRMDMILTGAPSDGSGYRTRIYYQTSQGSFVMDGRYPLVPVNQDGGINMGDVNGDGNMDVVVGGYVGTYEVQPAACYASPLRVYENRPADSDLPGNTFPLAPASVQVGVEGDELLITWSAGSDVETAPSALRYNILVHNETTGEIYTMIPADPAAGRLKVGTDLQTSLASNVGQYRIKHFGAGTYTVGVQTLDQSYAGSPFATARVVVTETSLPALPESAPIRIERHAAGIVIQCSTLRRVEVRRMDGCLCAVGVSGQSIPVAPGIYWVRVGETTLKLAY